MRSGEPQNLDEALARIAELETSNLELQVQLAERELFWGQAERRAVALAEATQAFAVASLDVEQLLGTIAQRTAELVGSGCAVLLCSQDRSRLNLVAHHDNDAEAGARLRGLLSARPILVGEGLTGRVVTTGSPMVLNDIDLEQLAAIMPPDFRNYLQGTALRALLVQPISADNEVIGALVLGRSAPAARFEQQDLGFIADLATRIGISLSRAQLLSKLAIELTERRRAEQQLEATEEQLRQARRLEAIGLLAGGIAHDFNNLLTVILSTTALMSADTTPSHPWHSDIEAIAKAGHRARDLTRQLLAFSRKQVLQPRVLDAGTVITELRLMLQRVIGENVLLQLDLDGSLPRVHVDRGQLEQSLMNLVANARDALPSGGKIVFTTREVQLDGARITGAEPGRYIQIVISDNGLGMSAETQARLFEPFFTTKERGRGTGLGLAAVYGIVKQSGGHIEVSSTPGQGTQVALYLPAVDAQVDSEPAAHRPAPVAAVSQATQTVLIVEDEDQVREVVRRVLERGGYTTLTASGLQEALRQAHSHIGPIDLLLSDVVLAHTDGPELAVQLRALRPGLRVLFMTGYSERALATAELNDANVTLIQKPFTPQSLLEQVRVCLS